MMEKRNVVEDRRTPKTELVRKDADWDTKVASDFSTIYIPEDKKQSKDKPIKK